MASFSFGAGNARKLAALPLFALGRLATFVIPRTGDAWVFGCGAGIGDGALALWKRVRDEGHEAIWLTGSAREARDAARLGIPTVSKSSLRGFWRTARAHVVVVTHGFGDVNRFAVSGAFVVQLWHGIPLKRIGLDSPETLRVPRALGPLAPAARHVLRAMFRSAAQRIDVLPAASHPVRGRLESAFSLADDRVPVTGEPRVDVLSRGTPEVRRSTARGAVDVLAGPIGSSRLVLYAPTWRDGDADPAIPSPEEWHELLTVLERQDAILLVRSHPLGAGDYEPPVASERVRPLGSALVSDVTPLLPALDALVTDYSSLVFDAALVPLPVVFLAPDVEAYARRRGFYGRYRDVAGDDPARTWTRATRRLDAILGEAEARDAALERSRELSAEVHSFRDGGNTARVYRAIRSRLVREQGRGRR